MEVAPPHTYALTSSTEIRLQFPALSADEVMLDGAGGTQVPEPVIAAVAAAMRSAMSNVGGAFAASRISTETVSESRAAVADLVGGVADGVVLGPSMTALTFRVANALAKTWGPGDEVVVTSLDHDANVRPWRIAAERAGAAVRVADFDVESGELPVSAVEATLSERSKVVAVTAASNAIGTRPDIAAICDRAHDAGALTYVDGVHATPHLPTDVRAIGADFYACSSYKFCGPHTGFVVADPGLLDSLHPDKLVPSPSAVPHRFERGTSPFELLAGVRAAIDWLADLTDSEGSRRERLVASLTAIEDSLEPLLAELLEGLAAIDGVRILGAARRRTPTVSFTVSGRTPRAVAEALAERRIAVWAGDNYAYELMRRFGLGESGGAVRASLVLYNTADEVARFLAAVEEIAGAR